ncbi:tRNA N6-adenosine threonylcarbamoyltransferase [Colletotrichum siamense]|nr:tRNA N6-adenosine threonylcarbamoyltransferase [Colletotrichum siamense]
MRTPPLQIQWRAVLRRQVHGNYPQHHHRRNLLTLAIETSCDDTCVALLSKTPAGANLHFNRKITSDHRAFGGIWPPAALAGHDASLAPLIAESLSSLPPPVDDNKTITVSGVPRQKPDFITVTRGPGMSSNLATGLSTAKGLATAWQVPLVAVNHMQAHALTPRLVSALKQDAATSTAARGYPAFPFLTLLVSGGHTQLVHSRSLTDHRILASTQDIAVGDALDKAARHILPADMLAAHTDVMYGALLERFAFPDAFPPGQNLDYDYEYTPPTYRRDEIATYVAPAPYHWQLHPPLAGSRDLSYAFAGIGSEIRRITEAGGVDMTLDERRVLARAAMRLLFEHLATRVFLVLAAEPELKDALKTLVVSGGVASNRFLMYVLRKMLNVRGFEHVEVTAPPPALCTDNAAMIAWTGMEMYEAGWESDLSVSVMKKWSIDAASDEGGILGVRGWVRRDGQKS